MNCAYSLAASFRTFLPIYQASGGWLSTGWLSTDLLEFTGDCYQAELLILRYLAKGRLYSQLCQMQLFFFLLKQGVEGVRLGDFLSKYAEAYDYRAGISEEPMRCREIKAIVQGGKAV